MFDFFDDGELAMLFAMDKQHDLHALTTMSVLHEAKKAGKPRGKTTNNRNVNKGGGCLTTMLIILAIPIIIIFVCLGG